MDEHPTPPNGRKSSTLTQPAVTEQREIMQLWQRSVSGMDGQRSGLPETPDDAVAHKLLDAAGDAMNRGEWQKGVNILKLVVKDYRHSQEAACARQVIDRLASRHR